MVNLELLKILCCPETHQNLSMATPDQVKAINAAIASGTLKNRGGKQIEKAVQAALIREDKLFAYAIRDNIPIMLVDEAFPFPS